MSDTWSDIQAVKSKQNSLREKLARRKKERQDVVDELIKPASVTAVAPANSGSSSVPAVPVGTAPAVSDASSVAVPQTLITAQPPAEEKPKIFEPTKLSSEVLLQVEQCLVTLLTDIALILPVEGASLYASVQKSLDRDLPYSAVDDLLQKYATQGLLSLSGKSDDKSGEKSVVETVDHTKLSALWDLESNIQVGASQLGKRKRERDDSEVDTGVASPAAKVLKKSDSKPVLAIESLLNQQSAKERENKKLSEEIQMLLTKSTAKEQLLAEKFRSQGGKQVREFCTFGTKEECNKSNTNKLCDKLHFLKIIRKHTDESLGDCSFLNTCFHMDTCKYVHYEIDYSSHTQLKPKPAPSNILALPKASSSDTSTTLFPAQWVQCDLRRFDMSVLGKFSVIMADPPWDIHMELPYGTMSDDEMRKLNVPILQDDGFIFLWVTGRAMELGRECLTLWGYERVDEIIWVKTNQLQRIIRTGRTGHWLNHGKEHCLVGVKGNPKNVNRGLDCDVIVAEVRATSHKPDEIYGIIERLSPGSRKIELFGRPHNIQPNWVTLGNQVDHVKLLDPEVVRAFLKVYPDGNCMKPAGAP